jgi:hypothetical protein
MIDLLCNAVEVATQEQSFLGAVIMGEKMPIFNYDWWTIGISFFAFVVSAFSLYYAWLTYNSQEKVAQNTQQLNPKTQYRIMIDIVRHLYRNLVVMWAITNKMRLSNYKIYPAEIHLQKAKVPLDIIHFELYTGLDYKQYVELQNLDLMLRNYNLELDIAAANFAKKNLKPDVKEYYIKTLLFKPGYIADKIFELFVKIYANEFSYDQIKKDAVEWIIECHNINVRGNEGREQWDKVDEFNYYYELNNQFLITLFKERKNEFFKMLKEDAKIECGKNTEGEFKLLFIEFDE